jgi:hypothetical protein
MSKVAGIFCTAVVATAALFFFAGFGIKGHMPMPGYAAVYLDDQTETYIALPCMKDWQDRAGPGRTVRLAKAREALQMKYGPDADCRDTGAFAPEAGSMSGRLLVKLGIMQPVQFWWDAPYRTEDGTLVYPKP